MKNNSVIDQPTRLVSLDALRGFDMFWIMSGEHIIHALAKATGWFPFVWMSNQLYHTVWDGFTFYDMIFPLFIFIAGVSIPYSIDKKVQAWGIDSPHQLPPLAKREIYAAMIKRTCILIVLGLVVNGALEFNGYENTRFASVLARIGLATFFAGLIYLNFSIRKQFVWILALLLGYWAVMMLVPVPGFGAGVLTMEGSFESYVDGLLLPGRLYDVIHDPEGVLSTIPAIATAMLGVFTGTFLKWNPTNFSMPKKAFSMLVLGFVFLALGLLWNMVFPINKRLWSSSFVIYAGGWSLILLSVFYFIIDVLGFKRWAFPFVIIGVNSILIYICAEGGIDFAHTAHYIFGGIINNSPIVWQPVFVAVSVTLIQLISLYFFYKKKIFLKM